MLLAAALVFGCARAGEGVQPPTVEDAVEMVRVQNYFIKDGPIGSLSPDGRWFAFVTSQGDIAHNANIYRIVVADLDARVAAGKAARPVFTTQYSGDPADQHASAIEHVTFFSDNRTVAFLGRDASDVQQVFSVDIHTGEVEQLTSHPTSVREFAIAAGSGVRFYSALAPADGEAERLARLQTGGFLWDETLFSPAPGLRAASGFLNRPRWVRQYFVVDQYGPKRVYDSRQNRASRSQDERGRRNEISDERMLRNWSMLAESPVIPQALMYPYAPADIAPADAAVDNRVAPYGLIDLRTGTIERFIDMPLALPGSANGGGPPMWSPDGRSAVVFVSASGKDDAPHWVEVEVASRKVSRLPAAAGWKVLGWSSNGSGLVLGKDSSIATLARAPNGAWGALETLGTFPNLDWRWTPATNGRVLLGLFEGLHSPPEVAVLDLQTRKVRTLSDLNPSLRARRYGKVEEFHWSHELDPEASGFLVYPQSYTPGKKYPLVILLDDGNLKRIAQPFLLDAFMQLNGHAIQMIAAEGMMVLYTREPKASSRGVSECEAMSKHIDAAIDALERLQRIDPKRVGLSGWSRAGYHTDCVLMRGHRQLAAATRMDGGGADYLPAVRAYTDQELLRIRAPLLVEVHGQAGLAIEAAMADRLQALGGATEILYLPMAPHSTVRPAERLLSLNTHLDWWKFWLQDREGSDPGKAEQYRRWRQLRGR